MRFRRLTTATATATGVVALIIGGTAPSSSATANATAACGAASQGIVNAGYEASAQAIYHGELVSHEVTKDLAHVTSSKALVEALASGDQAAVTLATHAIVYTPHWHIVRVRVLSTSGKVLADVGGPDVLAPVAGQISYHGTVVGSFLMSVQDDLGYEKLVTRFTGLPIELYASGTPLMGRDFPAADVPPADPPTGTSLSVAGVASTAVSFSVLAFPSGHTRVLIAVPSATAALRGSSCTEVNAETYGEVSVHLAARLNLSINAEAYVLFDQVFDTAKLTFVRRGATQLASSNNLPGPATIPTSGPVAYNGHTWLVYSFPANHSTRVYLLFPDDAPPATGTTGSTAGTGAS